ncbi:MAG: DUF6029 family protein [Candidatus Cloacimonetes bacterium]|nr:DUF6029 family protein [Candidatus Cloacimonadota bacterium]MCF7814584.1 DUF6029 family protein [Candidatus Cloacimonadota bacterium]MCF7869097.1 DUF6029 family protein [Candidatus Cloacimonadota bacterium]MCF7884514.1 DUF6029 family protein [Candidatus Cloacimonadota bacterium]
MKYQKVILTLILIVLLGSLVANEFYVSGLNEFKFINANRIIENRNYISNKFQIQAFYEKFRLGLKYDLYRPRFDKFLEPDASLPDSLNENKLASEKDENYFDEYYLQYESDYWFLQAGTYEAVIGTGLVLHNFYDDDFEQDTRLIGGYANPYYDKWQMQLFAGLMESDDPSLKDEYDQVGAIDADVNITDELSLGEAFVIHKQLDADTEKFNKRVIHSRRIKYSSYSVEFNGEYASSTDENDLEGTAIYANATSYIGKFTFNASYKNYENFNVRISDLPVVNHSGQPLHHSWDPGRDEEGIMGEIKFLPNYENELIINYAEGWSSDFKVRQSNLYSEYKRDFETFSIKGELETLEQLRKDYSKWHKEITPAVTFDLLLGENPLLLKAEYQLKEDENLLENYSYYEPRLQVDFSMGDYSLSVTVENQQGESDTSEGGDDGEFWIGGELAIMMMDEPDFAKLGMVGDVLSLILKDSDIRLFYGKEKGGIVCRNGVCKNQAEFDGLRLSWIKTF